MAQEDGGPVVIDSVEPLTLADREAIDGWLEEIADACREGWPPPASFVDVPDTFEHACEAGRTRRQGPWLINPESGGWFERPEQVTSEPGEVLASVGIRNSGWELHFRLLAGEVTAVWTWFGAACPFVVVRTLAKGEVRWLERGEILRNLRGPETEARQSVSLPVTQRALTIRIEERKNEVTHLDDVYVEFRGRRIQPSNCPRAPYCLDDQIYVRIEPGEFVVLEFDVPPSWVGHDVPFFAEGHYRVRAEPPPPVLFDMNANGWPR